MSSRRRDPRPAGHVHGGRRGELELAAAADRDGGRAARAGDDAAPALKIILNGYILIERGHDFTPQIWLVLINRM